MISLYMSSVNGTGLRMEGMWRRTEVRCFLRSFDVSHRRNHSKFIQCVIEVRHRFDVVNNWFMSTSIHLLAIKNLIRDFHVFMLQLFLSPNTNSICQNLSYLLWKNICNQVYCSSYCALNSFILILISECFCAYALQTVVFDACAGIWMV